jgi:hypothetical protein
MRRRFVVLSGIGGADRREWVNSAAEALERVRRFEQLRRPNVRIEDVRGNPVSFFELKDEAAAEGRIDTAVER